VPDFTVRAHGTDSSGRTIWATDYMWAWWERVCDDLGFRPTIVQGAFMVRNGGGASASAGYHDAGGCFDLRVWDLGASQVEDVIRTCRELGAAAWLRNTQHGGFTDPHVHFVLGADHDLDSGAAWQWRAYLAGRDGLASNGPDYHWRPTPLVTTPPEDDMTPQQAATLDRVAQDVAELKGRVNEIAKNTAKRDAALRKEMRKKFKATDAQIDEVLAAVDQ
jgi:hypothetical protein